VGAARVLRVAHAAPNSTQCHLVGWRSMHPPPQAWWQGACVEAAPKGALAGGFPLPPLPSLILENHVAHCEKKKNWLFVC